MQVVCLVVGSETSVGGGSGQHLETLSGHSTLQVHIRDFWIPQSLGNVPFTEEKMMVTMIVKMMIR